MEVKEIWILSKWKQIFPKVVFFDLSAMLQNIVSAYDGVPRTALFLARPGMVRLTDCHTVRLSDCQTVRLTDCQTARLSD